VTLPTYRVVNLQVPKLGLTVRDVSAGELLYLSLHGLRLASTAPGEARQVRLAHDLLVNPNTRTHTHTRTSRTHTHTSLSHTHTLTPPAHTPRS
jgi:rRNA maturation protein Rpf1